MPFAWHQNDNSTLKRPPAISKPPNALLIVLNNKGKVESWLKNLVIFGLLVTFYTLTRPLNHSESYDCFTYALFAENYELGKAPDSRNILFQATNRLVYLAAQTVGVNVGTLDLLVGSSIITGALSLLLFARLMQVGFGASPVSAWAGAIYEMPQEVNIRTAKPNIENGLDKSNELEEYLSKSQRNSTRLSLRADFTIPIETGAKKQNKHLWPQTKDCEFPE